MSRPSGFRKRRRTTPGSRLQHAKAFPIYGSYGSHKRQTYPRQNIRLTRLKPNFAENIKQQEPEEYVPDTPILIVDKEEQANEEPNMIVVDEENEEEEEGRIVKQPKITVMPRKKGIIEQLDGLWHKVRTGTDKVMKMELPRREENED